MLYNTCIILGILLCLLIGNELNKRNRLSLNILFGILIALSISPNLIGWFSWANSQNVLIGGY
jgi:apolipoprotein N-acyltransferase